MCLIMQIRFWGPSFESFRALPRPGFAPLADEFRLWPLLRRLADARVPLALPVMAGKGKPLLFRAWQPGDVTAAGVWGCAETYLIHTPARERKGPPQYFEDLAVGTASKQAH